MWDTQAERLPPARSSKQVRNLSSGLFGSLSWLYSLGLE